MNIISVRQNIEWLPQPNEIRLVLANELPPHEFITAAFVLAFQGDEMIATNLSDRGWDIPGGHIDVGEHPADAMRRELYEEAGAVIETPKLLGYQMICLQGEKPPGYKYPYPNSYMVFYCAKIAKLDSFEGNTEATERALFGPERVRVIPWVRENFLMYEEALRRVESRSK